MNKSLFVFVLIALLITSCNLPGNTGTDTPESPEAVYTHAAETMSAELTRVASLASPTLNSPTGTFTSSPTNTPVYSPTKTPIPCLLVGYSDATIDVTVPDNTVMAPGQAFTKTWRLTNTGTCTWNSSYQLVFDGGDGMGVPSNYSQTLTTGTVAPGQTVDVSVNLVAPMTPGTYTGYWRFRDPSGVLFGIGGTFSWIVKIKVVNATTVTLPAVVGESGSARGDGHITTAEIIVGDASTNYGLQVFLSFNISGIPTNATITEVKIDFTGYTAYGNPFSNLGCLDVYESNYGVLDGTDFFVGVPSGPYFEWCNTTALSTVGIDGDFKTLIQSKLGNSRIQARLQFPTTLTDMDGTADAVSFSAPKLIVSYTTP